MGCYGAIHGRSCTRRTIRLRHPPVIPLSRPTQGVSSDAEDSCSAVFCRFTGTTAGGRYSETIIGMLAPNNRTAVALDNDGQNMMTLVDANTIDVCYSHLYPTSKVVACFQLKRTP
jgi:hypothetical protein